MKLSEALNAPNWQRVDQYPAPENVPVLTKIDDENGCRNVQVMTRKKNLFYCSDGMYVYYLPTHWAYDKDI